MNNLAFSYIRCSTKEQLKGASIRRQLKKAEEYAKKNNLILSEKGYQDLGIPAFRGKNLQEGSELYALIEAIEKGAIPPGSTLLVENLDRLSRTFITKSLPLFMRIIDAGVRVATLVDGKVYDTEGVNKNPMDLMYSINVLFRAHEESASKRDRIADAWREAQENAHVEKIPNSYPSWLSLKDNKFSVDKGKAKLVKDIFARFLAGDSTNRIARELNEEGRFTFTGKKWVQTTIKFILKNPSVIGEYHAGKRVEGKKVKTGKVVKGYYPPIISEECFYRAQARFKLTPTKIGRPQKADANLFAGIIKCPYCGGSMGIYGAKTSRSFICWNSINGGCIRAAISAQFVETAVLGSTGKIAASAATAKLDVRKIERLEGEIAEIKTKVKNIVKLVASGADIAEARDELTTLKASQNEKERALMAERAIDGFKKTSTDKAIMRMFAGMKDDAKTRLELIPHIRRHVRLIEPYFVGDLFEQYRKELKSYQAKGISGGACYHALRAKFGLEFKQYVKIHFNAPVVIGGKETLETTIRRYSFDEGWERMFEEAAVGVAEKT